MHVSSVQVSQSQNVGSLSRHDRASTLAKGFAFDCMFVLCSVCVCVCVCVYVCVYCVVCVLCSMCV